MEFKTFTSTLVLSFFLIETQVVAMDQDSIDKSHSTVAQSSKLPILASVDNQGAPDDQDQLSAVAEVMLGASRLGIEVDETDLLTFSRLNPKVLGDINKIIAAVREKDLEGAQKILQSIPTKKDPGKKPTAALVPLTQNANEKLADQGQWSIWGILDFFTPKSLPSAPVAIPLVDFEGKNTKEIICDAPSVEKISAEEEKAPSSFLTTLLSLVWGSKTPELSAQEFELLNATPGPVETQTPVDGTPVVIQEQDPA